MNKIAYPSITINKIKLKNGKSLILESDDIVILVGGNNVGKSRIIKDIKNDINNRDSKVILDEIKYIPENVDKNNMINFIKKNYIKDSNGFYQIPCGDNSTSGYNESNFNNIPGEYRQLYSILYTYLGTEDRLLMTNPINNYDTRKYNIINTIKHFRQNIADLNKLNSYLYRAFKEMVCVEETLSLIAYKMGSNLEINELLKNNYIESADKLRKLKDLSDQGDGIRSFTAILGSLIAGKHKLFLIDEPETFLHPPQARMLGKFILELSKGKQCIIATHDIDFLKGILEKNSNRVRVIKIDREGDNNYFSEVNKNDLNKIFTNKTLKYTNILDGLFYDRVILCENESDCKFYSTILADVSSNKYLDTLFCGVGGKDSFKTIVPLLKKINIKYSVIADIDLITSRKSLKDLLNSTKENSFDEIAQHYCDFISLFQKEKFNLIPKQIEIKEKIDSYYTTDEYMLDKCAENIRAAVKVPNNFKVLKEKGISCIKNKKCKEEYYNIKKYLKKNNIYILDVGEIESFYPLESYHGELWVDEMFKKYAINSNEYNSAKKFIRNVFSINKRIHKNK